MELLYNQTQCVTLKPILVMTTVRQLLARVWVFSWKTRQSEPRSMRNGHSATHIVATPEQAMHRILLTV